jgi:hypothetical protein
MNEIHFYCLFCGAGIDSKPGLNVCECPKCTRFTPVPIAAGIFSPHVETYPPDIISVEVKFPCPECGKRLEMDAWSAGKAGFCPLCSTEIQCPSLSFLIVSRPETAQAPKANAARIPLIHLSREEIEFLSLLESSGGRAARHAS